MKTYVSPTAGWRNGALGFESLRSLHSTKGLQSPIFVGNSLATGATTWSPRSTPPSNFLSGICSTCDSLRLDALEMLIRPATHSPISLFGGCVRLPGRFLKTDRDGPTTFRGYAPLPGRHHLLMSLRTLKPSTVGRAISDRQRLAKCFAGQIRISSGVDRVDTTIGSTFDGPREDAIEPRKLGL